MHIAILSVHTCPLASLGGKKTGGMNVFIREISRVLDARGIEVDIFTRAQGSCSAELVHRLGKAVRVIHIPAGPDRSLLPTEQVAYLDLFAEGMINFSAENRCRYDLIYSHYWLSGLVAEKLRTEWGDEIPIVQIFHTLGKMKNLVAMTAEELAPRSRIMGEKRIIDSIADCMTAPTPAETIQLVELYGANPQKIVVLPAGLNIEQFNPMSRQLAMQKVDLPIANYHLLAIGRIEPLKGFDTLLQAVALLRTDHPEFFDQIETTIIGGDPHASPLETEMARLLEMRRALDLEEKVSFIGAKPQSELPYYYASADIVVAPSHYESFGLVPLEAMAMGTPVIASAVGGLTHLVQNGKSGYLIPPRNPSALAERICQLLHSPQERIQMGEYGKNYAKNYDWHIIGDQLIVLFHRQIEEKAMRQTRSTVIALSS